MFVCALASFQYRQLMSRSPHTVTDVTPQTLSHASVFLFLVWQDFAYHGIAAFFYLSASVALAKVTLDMKDGTSFQNYQLDISAVVSQAVSC